MIYIIEYTTEAEKDIAYLVKSGDKAILLKLRKLLIELREHPREGTGKPKVLKHYFAGCYSRRITGKHRLVYSIDDEKVTVLVLSVSGHYDDK